MRAVKVLRLLGEGLTRLHTNVTLSSESSNREFKKGDLVDMTVNHKNDKTYIVIKSPDFAYSTSLEYDSDESASNAGWPA